MPNFFHRIGDFFQGTDRFTRMLQLDQRFLNRWVTEKEIYETINNNEFHLYNTTPELAIVLNRRASMFTNGVSVIKDWRTGKVIENHPLLKLLERPNPLQNRNEWLIDICLKHDLYGNVYAFKNKGSRLSEFPSQITNLPNHDLKIITSGKIWKQNELDKIITSYQLESTKEDFKPNEIIHLKNSNPNDPIKGISPLHAIQMPLSNIRGAYGFRNVNITKRGALGIMSPDGKDSIGAMTLNPEQRKQLEQEFIKDNGIFDNQSPIKFANIPMKYDHLSYPIKENMLFEEIDADFKRIIDNYSMNENIFSRTNSSKFSNLQEGLKMCYQDSVIPFGEKVSYAINDGLKLYEMGIYHEFDFSRVEVLQDNQEVKATVIKTKADAYETLIQNGIPQKDAEIITGLRL